ncbi:hypothetical protein FRB94_014215 [Tulasnella sp. JGI-2019a]|nr:hypothetical protein FRB93_005438 [Tulasnella sp. JGI-2019a]KAG9014123.1 hypothetical protein FRB94_014215 [Tulasnella sp. JGI-2019a]KAG9023054.1 hypothetical protein FRB95_013742 [Tulasnella sp. JGI-2019a]
MQEIGSSHRIGGQPKLGSMPWRREITDSVGRKLQRPIPSRNLAFPVICANINITDNTIGKLFGTVQGISKVWIGNCSCDNGGYASVIQSRKAIPTVTKFLDPVATVQRTVD